MRPIAFVNLLCLVACTAACTAACTPDVQSPEFEPAEPASVPAPPGSSGPRLESGANGAITLSWMSPGDPGPALMMAEWRRDRWGPASTVVADPDMFVNWADLPAVRRLDDDRLLAHWLSRSGAATYAYDVLVAMSGDNGQSWSQPIRPHADGTETEHGFVSTYAAVDGIGLIWLDGRETATGGGMTLRSAILSGGMEIQDGQLVDELICDCCQTDVAVGEHGPVAVYRDRSEGEIRDIHVTRFVDGRWQAGTPIRDDGWRIAACPVNGPAIDAAGGLVAVAWFTAADDRPVVRAALSVNGGRSFREPVTIATGDVRGHVGVAVLNDRSAAVSWMAKGDDATVDIFLRTVLLDGDAGEPFLAGRSNVARTVPQMIRSGTDLVLAWTDRLGDATRVVSVRVPFVRPEDV